MSQKMNKHLENYLNSGEFYEAVVEDGSDMIFIVDYSGIIMYYNPAAEMTLGYDKDELLNKKFHDFIHEDFRQDFTEDFNNSTQRPFNENIEFMFLCHDGKYRYYEFNSINIYHKKGIEGLILDCRDITQRKENAAELMRAQKAKEQFLANMSHEIRTPINGIAGMATLMAETEDEEERKSYLDAIIKSAQNLKVIINDILDFSVIESGKLKFEKISFSVKEQVNNVANNFLHQAREKGLAFNIQVEPDADLVVEGDPVRLSQILINLISNAMKFTHKGLIGIHVNLHSSDNYIRHISFEVRDTGIGIPKEKLTKIFDSFTQADTSVTRRYGGTGLGLAITKQLVDLQNGNILVKSKENEGTSFIITIPYILGTQEIKPEEQPVVDSNGFDLSDKRVLVVEDNEINRLYVSRLLKKWGIEVAEEENGLLGVERYDAEDFDLILMDLQMPILDGIEATRKIRNRYSGKKANVPIIALTANAIKGDNERCLEAGMSDYISKPFKPEDLRSLIIRHLSFGEENPAEDTEDYIAITNMDHLNDVCGGDTTFIQEMIGIFIDAIPKAIKNMKDFSHEQSWKKVGEIAHSIKPSISLMGMDDALNTIRQIEEYGSTKTNVGKIPRLLKKLEIFSERAIAELKDFRGKI